MLGNKKESIDIMTNFAYIDGNQVAHQCLSSNLLHIEI